jgi:hypothetical protein
LYRADDPIGEENDEALVKAAKGSELVIAAWGVHGELGGRGEEVATMLREITDLRCLGATQAGHPRHPLYLRKDLQPIPFEGAAAAAL